MGDIDEALAFYGRIFEIELRGRVPRMAFIDIGDQFIALSEGRTQSADDARHFGLVVDEDGSRAGRHGPRGVEQSPEALKELREKGLG